MKNRILLSIATTLLSATMFAQTPVMEWAARYDYSDNTDVFLDMVQDAAGNTYVCGYSDALSTGTDIIVAKFELDGDTAWFYRYEGQYEDRAVAIALTNNNDVVVTGHSESGTTGWDAITIVIDGNTGLAMSGWPQFYNGDENGKDFANDVAVRQTDNMIAICGAIEDEDNSEDLMLVSYAPNGSLNWEGAQSSSNNIDTDHANLFCAFFNNGNVAAISRITNGSFGTTVVAEFDILNGNNGSVEEFGTLSSNSLVDPYVYTHVVPKDIYVYNNTIYALADWNSYQNVYGSSVYKINPTSDQLLSPQAEHVQDEPDTYSMGVAANSSRIYISGAADVNSFSAIDLDGFVASFDQNGNQQYYQTYDNGGDDAFNDIAIDNLSNANAYVTGFTAESGNKNIVKAKFTSTGSLDWDMQYNGTGNGEDEAYCIAIGNGNTAGSIWVCGKSVGQGTGDDGIAIKCCVPPVADAGQDKGFCTGNGVQIGTASIAGYTYEWTPPTGLDNPNISNPTVSHSVATDCPIDYEYVVKVTNTNGCSAYDTAQVTEYHFPEVSIVASQPNVICENESPIVITPAVDIGCEGSATYSWEQDNAQVSTSSNAYEVSTVNQSGNYTLVVTNSYGTTSCTTTSNSVSATVNPLPVGSATDISICSGETTNIPLSSSLSGTTYSWSANATGTVSGEGGGSGNIIAQTLSGDGTVSYEVTPTVTATGCVGDDFTVAATVNPLPAAPSIIPDGPIEFCNGGSVTLTSTTGNTYSWSPNGESSASILVDASGSYTVTISDINGCENTSLPLSVTVNDNPVADAGSDLTFCEGFSQFIGGNPTASGGQAGYTYAWSNGPNLNDATSANPNVLTSLTSGNYSFTVTVTDQNQCEDSDQVLVEITSGLVANAGQDQTICVGDTVQLVGTGGDTYVWSSGNSLDDANVSDPLASPSDTTEYQLIISANGCENDTAWVTVNVAPLPPQPTVTVSGLDITCLESGYSYQWNLDGSELNGETGQTIYNANQNGDYTVTITDGNGCLNTSTPPATPVGVTETEQLELSVYPNPSSGQFELVVPQALDNNGSYQIYNGFGQLVKEENIASERMRIDVSGFADGVYLLRLIENNVVLGVERIGLINR